MKFADPAYLEYNFVATMTVFALNIQSVNLPSPTPAVVAIILADAPTQATQNRVQMLVVSITLTDDLTRKKT